MLFSSTVFIFIFLPVLLAVYYLIPRRFLSVRNIVLLIASLIFYAWGEPKFVLVMIASIASNYIFGRWIGITVSNIRERPNHQGSGKSVSRFLLILGVVANLGLLFIFKYLNFAVSNIDHLLELLGISEIPQTAITLPIGISFFTFQAVSYLVDV